MHDVAHLCFYMFLRCSKLINLWLPHSCFWIASCLVFASKNIWKVFKNKLLHGLVSLQNVARREPPPPHHQWKHCWPWWWKTVKPYELRALLPLLHCRKWSSNNDNLQRREGHEDTNHSWPKTHRIYTTSSVFFLELPFLPDARRLLVVVLDMLCLILNYVWFVCCLFVCCFCPVCVTNTPYRQHQVTTHLSLAQCCLFTKHSFCPIG